MVNKKTSKLLTFPLLERLQNRDQYSIFEHENFDVPKYIPENLKHALRPYQYEAIRYFHYAQEEKQRHLLFHMATGAGKTNVMAATILYLYKEKGMQDFLFLVNTKGIVEKTKENLLNQYSPKYLYKHSIIIEGEKISFKEVKRFPTIREKNTIYIRIDTIQSVASELNNTKENGLVYEDFAKKPIVILGDEAHHFNAFTKANLSKEEKMERDWERTLNKIREKNENNLQLEFTATIDVDKEVVYEKYKEKVVYRYALDRFIDDKYSKKVYRLQANNDDEDKMLNAVLLSQYRKYIALKHSIPHFKPVILFKSARIEVSHQIYKRFIELIENLTVELLSIFIQKQKLSTTSTSLTKAYDYYSTISLAKVIVDLKEDFRKENLIDVNDKGNSGIIDDINIMKKLNTLESPDNPIRAVFAVAKLSEGWDVLNLHDIVRISETATATPSATSAEAQLIGRGARYNPFKYEGARSFTRRFDDIVDERTILESLHYHTINDTAYLKNLKKSLDTMQLQVEEDVEGTVHYAVVKEGFKTSRAYRQGKLFFNETEEVPLGSYNSISSYGINTQHPWTYIFDNTIENTLADYGKNFDFHTYRLPLDKRIFKKAIARNRFFKFDNLKKYLPKLTSIEELLTTDQWLKTTNIEIKLPKTLTLEDLTAESKLKIVEQYLSYVEDKIRLNFKKKRGTNRFIGYAINGIVKDYIRVVKPTFSGNSITQEIGTHDMSKRAWFVYDNAIVNKTERTMIDWLSNFIEPLKRKYLNIHLIRIDEQNTNLSLRAFKNSIGNYKGFIPDFVLYLENAEYIYQLFLEPKGEKFLEQDQWKEDLLQSLNTEDIELIGENDTVKLFGLKFYTIGDSRNVEQQLSELVFDGESLTEQFEMK